MISELHNRVCATIFTIFFLMPSEVMAQTPEFPMAQIIDPLRAMIGKPLRDQTIEFNNKTTFVLEVLTPEGSRFFWGGTRKQPDETADDLRENHGMVILMTPCQGIHDLNSKISSISVWETLDDNQKLGETPHVGLGMEQLLAMMNSPPGIVSPSTLRAPRAASLHGPVFEYVRGDTKQTLGFFNEGNQIRINWTVENSSFCSK